MSKIAGSAIGLLVLPAIAVAQPSPALTIGWLNYSAGTISQDLSVRNNGVRPIKAVRIGCRFFQYINSKQLGAGAVEIENIASNAVGYKTMIIASHTSPTSATCHIVSVKN
jgi:hypothetical protein